MDKNSFSNSGPGTNSGQAQTNPSSIMITGEPLQPEHQCRP